MVALSLLSIIDVLVEIIILKRCIKDKDKFTLVGVLIGMLVKDERKATKKKSIFNITLFSALTAIVATSIFIIVLMIT